MCERDYTPPSVRIAIGDTTPRPGSETDLKTFLSQTHTNSSSQSKTDRSGDDSKANDKQRTDDNALMAILIGCGLGALFILGSFVTGIVLWVFGQSPQHLCEGLNYWSRYYTSPYTLVYDCNTTQPTYLLSGSTFCLNNINKECVDVSHTAQTLQSVGIGLTFAFIVPVLILIVIFAIMKSGK